MMAVRNFVVALTSSPPVSCKRTTARRIPPCPQIDQPLLLQLARKAKPRHTPALYLAPRVIGHRAQRRPSVVQRLAHTAERIGSIPCACSARQGRQPLVAI